MIEETPYEKLTKLNERWVKSCRELAEFQSAFLLLHELHKDKIPHAVLICLRKGCVKIHDERIAINMALRKLGKLK